MQLEEVKYWIEFFISIDCIKIENNFHFIVIALIDQDALTEALQNKKIAGAGLDVTVPEPLNPDHPLLKMDNVGKILSKCNEKFLLAICQIVETKKNK